MSGFGNFVGGALLLTLGIGIGHYGIHGGDFFGKNIPPARAVIYKKASPTGFQRPYDLGLSWHQKNGGTEAYLVDRKTGNESKVYPGPVAMPGAGDVESFISQKLQEVDVEAAAKALEAAGASVMDKINKFPYEDVINKSKESFEKDLLQMEKQIQDAYAKNKKKITKEELAEIKNGLNNAYSNSTEELKAKWPQVADELNKSFEKGVASLDELLQKK